MGFAQISSVVGKVSIRQGLGQLMAGVGVDIRKACASFRILLYRNVIDAFPEQAVKGPYLGGGVFGQDHLDTGGGENGSHLTANFGELADVGINRVKAVVLETPRAHALVGFLTAPVKGINHQI